MKYILFILLIFLAPAAHAQFGNRLKEKAKQVAERKANQKADEALNKGVDKIDSIITGKKREQKANDTKSVDPQQESTTTNDTTSANTASSSAESNYKEVIIITNIRCETGKKKLEAILRDTDGVSSILIDIDTGKLYLSSENPAIPGKAIEIIGQHGFEADDKKPTKPIADPCK